MTFSEKLRAAFPETTVCKSPELTAIFKAASIPSFMRDWILKRKADGDGRINDIAELQNYIAEIVPNRNSLLALETEARDLGASRKFLCKLEIRFNSRSNTFTFSLPELGLGHNETNIDNYVWENIKDELVSTGGGWGMIQLGYQAPGEGHRDGHFLLNSWRNFCPYRIDLDAYRAAREEFSVEEWIDVILGAMDYNPAGYESLEQKRTFLSRLLPFVEDRLNLIELAPKGTGKSYLFGQVGKYGWLISGGTVTRAKLFGDMTGKTHGLVEANDYVAFDEIQSIQFSNPGEIQGGLKAYMESGEFTVGKTKHVGKAGVILLGNIPAVDMDETRDMFRILPEIFHESALLDRFHGFISGKDIPRMNQSMILRGWALNSEYFNEVMHKLREPAEALRYRSIAEELISYPAKADTRDTEAVLRLATAWLKMLFPHLKSASEIRGEDFDKWCLKPAVRMRSIIRRQLQIIDPLEYGNKHMADYRVNGH